MLYKHTETHMLTTQILDRDKNNENNHLKKIKRRKEKTETIQTELTHWANLAKFTDNINY